MEISYHSLVKRFDIKFPRGVLHRSFPFFMGESGFDLCRNLNLQASSRFILRVHGAELPEVVLCIFVEKQDEGAT